MLVTAYSTEKKPTADSFGKFSQSLSLALVRNLHQSVLNFTRTPTILLFVFEVRRTQSAVLSLDIFTFGFRERGYRR